MLGCSTCQTSSSCTTTRLSPGPRPAPGTGTPRTKSWSPRGQDAVGPGHPVGDSPLDPRCLLGRLGAGSELVSRRPRSRRRRSPCAGWPWRPARELEEHVRVAVDQVMRLSRRPAINAFFTLFSASATCLAVNTPDTVAFGRVIAGGTFRSMAKACQANGPPRRRQSRCSSVTKMPAGVTLAVRYALPSVSPASPPSPALTRLNLDGRRPVRRGCRDLRQDLGHRGCTSAPARVAGGSSFRGLPAPCRRRTSRPAPRLGRRALEGSGGAPEAACRSQAGGAPGRVGLEDRSAPEAACPAQAGGAPAAGRRTPGRCGARSQHGTHARRQGLSRQAAVLRGQSPLRLPGQQRCAGLGLGLPGPIRQRWRLRGC